MSVHRAKPDHEVAFQDLCALMKKHADKLTPIDLLAVAANMVGKLIAMQDQRVTTPKIAIQTVQANIEQGNQQVLDELRQNTKGRG